MAGYRVDKVAVASVAVFLLVVCFLAGWMIPRPAAQTLGCPEEDYVQIVGNGDAVNHVTVYCEPPASN